MLLHKLFLLSFQLHFIIQEMLIICQILHRPLILLRVLVLLLSLKVYNLLVPLGKDVINLILPEAFEVIWHESVWSKLRFGCCFILSDDVAHVSPVDFVGVHIFLIVLPISFSIFLLLREHLVVLLKLLQLLLLLHRHLILEHASHSSDRLGLVRVVAFLILLIICVKFMLSGLFLDPLLLKRCVCIDSLSVIQVFAFELSAAGDVFWHLFGFEVCSFRGSFHLKVFF